MFQSPQNHIFPKGLTHAFGQKMPNFSLFLFEIRLEIMLNNRVEKKKLFWTIKKTQSPQKLTHVLGQEVQIFSFFVFGQNETRYKV